MAARSTLTVTSGTTITSAWGNNVRDNVASYTAGVADVYTEGQIATDTSSKRLLIHNGTTAVRLGHYTSVGRTGFEATSLAASTGSGATMQINWPTIAFNSDGFYTGWTGSVYGITIPSGLGGIYAVTVQVFTGTVSSGGMSIGLTIGGLLYTGNTPANTNQVSLSATVPMAAGTVLSLAVANLHSATNSYDSRIWLYRLGI